MKAAKLGP